jgi:hypothetical protein
VAKVKQEKSESSFLGRGSNSHDVAIQERLRARPSQEIINIDVDEV